MGIKIWECIGFGFSGYSGDEFSLNIKYRGEEHIYQGTYRTKQIRPMIRRRNTCRVSAEADPLSRKHNRGFGDSILILRCRQ